MNVNLHLAALNTFYFKTRFCCCHVIYPSDRELCHAAHCSLFVIFMKFRVQIFLHMMTVIVSLLTLPAVVGGGLIGHVCLSVSKITAKVMSQFH